MAYAAIPPTSSLVSTTYPLGVIDAGESASSLANAVVQANALGGGYVIALRRGTYRLTSQLAFTTSGNQLIGNGPGSTFLELDDTGLSGTDAILVSSVLQFALKGMSITATTARTAGSFLKVKGKNNITATPAQRTRQYTVEDVDAEDQFDGVSIVNGDNGDGAWGGFINRCEWMRFSAGGTYVDVNSTAGGQHYISDVKFYGSSNTVDANRALAGVRYRGGADLEMVNCNQIYMRHGLLVDPPSGQTANVLLGTSCLWDNNTTNQVKIAPAAGSYCNLIKLVNNWYGTNSASINTIDISGPAHSVTIDGGIVIGGTNGIVATGAGGATDIHVCNRVTVTGQSGKAFHATGSLQNFSVDMVAGPIADLASGLSIAAPAVGIDIDAGCDWYELRSNIHRCTTAITDDGGANKVVANL